MSPSEQPHPTMEKPNIFFLPIFLCLFLSFVLNFYYPMPLSDVLFSILYPSYLAIMNRMRFDSNVISRIRNLPEFSLGKSRFLTDPAFRIYMVVFQVVTVLLPLILIAAGPENVAHPAVSPLVLLLVQIAVENMQHSNHVHDIPKLLLPIGFNAYRLKSLATWIEVCAIDLKTTSYWELLGSTLAIVNTIMWSYNLFVFLLMRVLPVYFDEKDSPMPNIEWKFFLIPVIKRSKID